MKKAEKEESAKDSAEQAEVMPLKFCEETFKQIQEPPASQKITFIKWNMIFWLCWSQRKVVFGYTGDEFEKR